MNRREKALILFIASWVGIFLISAAGVLRLPGFLAERARLIELKRKLSDRKALQAKISVFMSDFKARIATLKQDLKKRKGVLDNCRFQSPVESDIPLFIENLQTLFSRQGINLVYLGYQAREEKNGFVKLPFEAKIRCSYKGMRELLYAIETHKTGIILDQIEFITLDDDSHQIQLKLSCSVRFKKIV